MPRNDVYSMWLWQLTKPGMMTDATQIHDLRARVGGHDVRRRADADDALAAHGERAVGEHRRHDGQQPVGAIDGDVVARDDRLSGRGHGGTTGART